MIPLLAQLGQCSKVPQAQGHACEAAALAVGAGAPASGLWRRLAVTALLVEAHVLGAFALPRHTVISRRSEGSAGDGPLPAGEVDNRGSRCIRRTPCPPERRSTRGLPQSGTGDPDLRSIGAGCFCTRESRDSARNLPYRPHLITIFRPHSSQTSSVTSSSMATSLDLFLRLLQGRLKGAVKLLEHVGASRLRLLRCGPGVLPDGR